MRKILFFSFLCIVFCSCNKNTANKVPAELLEKEYTDWSLPEFSSNTGETTLCVHYVSKKSVREKHVTIFVAQAFRYDDEYYECTTDSTGTICEHWQQTATAQVIIFSDFHKGINFFVEPAVKNEVWVDLDKMEKGETFLYTQGSLDTLNREFSKSFFYINYTDFNDDAEKYDDIKQYHKAISNHFSQKCDEIRQSDIPDLTKELYVELYRGYSLFYMFGFRNCSESDYNKECLSLIEEMDWNPLFLPYTAKSTGKACIYTTPLFASKIDSVMNNAEASNFLKSIALVGGSDNLLLNSISSDSVKCELMENVVPENVMDSIRATYRGQKVFIVLWGIHCGACEQEIDYISNFKNQYVEDPYPDVKMVYITTPNWSPIKDYGKHIENMKGDHYFVSMQAWNAILKSYNKSGIPLNILINTKGEEYVRIGCMRIPELVHAFDALASK